MQKFSFQNSGQLKCKTIFKNNPQEKIFYFHFHFFQQIFSLLNREKSIAIPGKHKKLLFTFVTIETDFSSARSRSAKTFEPTFDFYQMKTPSFNYFRKQPR